MKSLLTGLCFLSLVACAEGADAGTPAPVDAGSDAAAPDAGAACVRTPKTSLEILNACTDDDVEAIEKDPVLPLLLEDGGLPPLP
jgi:hypothetical protein